MNRTLGFDDPMPFGKFKGETISDLLDDEPEYIRWLIDKTDTVLHPDVVEAFNMAEKARGKG
jgi:hypothetical protein